MAIKKSQLYSALWSACDKLRGGMDASQYKDYVLVILFVKYISDKAKKGNNQLLTVPAGCSFDDLVALKNKPLIGESVNKILAKIAEVNGLTGVINSADFSDENKLGKGKDLVTTVSSLIQVFENDALDFSNNRAADDDLIGDAYEYLMKQFASQSGKSKGQFYTPAEVSRIMAKLIGISSDSRPNISIYDPTCGSGSLLLRAKAEAKTKVSLDGQEMDLATIGMAKMSMIIHGDELAELRHGDTLNNPLHTENDTTLEQFDYVVANPPFSQKAWMKSVSENDTYHRWGHETGLAPVPPAGCGDYAFLLHIIASLKPLGHGACILPHGVLFRGGAEQNIRKWLITKRYISGIIGLPQNLFYGTPIPACIIVIDKEHSESSKGIFMIDAKEGYQKDGSKNRLREQDIKLIVDTWNAHQDVPHYARFVEYNEIEKNDFNLSIQRYIAPVDKEIKQDIYAHLHGGIPSYDVEEVLAPLWNACPTLKDTIFQKQSNGYYTSLRPIDALSATIAEDPSYKHQQGLYQQVINSWCEKVKPEMLALKYGCEPKNLIEKWSNTLLEEAKKELKIVDPYNVYEILMNYWADTLQDDCYLISRDGWNAPLNLSLKKKPIWEDFTCDLLPVNIVVDEFFKKEKESIDTIREQIEEKNERQSEIVEETESEDATLKKEIAALKKSLKEKVVALTNAVQQKYMTLEEDDIRNLVVNNKWLNDIRERSGAEMKRVANDIATNVTDLCERYAQSLEDLDNEVNEFEKKVAANLAKMGF